MNTKYQPFDLQKAKEGAILNTRNGRSARIICYDRLTGKWPGKVIALVKGKTNIFENIVYYTEDGKQIDHIKDLDLMIVE